VPQFLYPYKKITVLSHRADGEISCVTIAKCLENNKYHLNVKIPATCKDHSLRTAQAKIVIEPYLKNQA
jgi:hypothetical protein